MADRDIQLRDEGAVVQGCGTGPVHAEQKEMVIRAVVHIDTNDPKFGKGSGFIAELEISRAEKKVVLMTCNHVLPSLAVAQKASIYFGRRSRTNPGIIIEGQELFNDRYFLTDDRTFPMWKRRFDYTVVEVKSDVLQEHLKDQAPEPLPLTKCAEMMKTEGLCLNNMLYMVHYPQKPVAFDRYENAEQICRIEGPYFGHMAETYGGSSGSPMLREYNNELIVVGLHRGDLGGQGHTYVNVATLITVILDDIRMVEYDDSKIPQLGSFATEAKMHAKELKNLPQKRPTPPKETRVNAQNHPESSSPVHSNGGKSNGGQSADAVLAMKVHGFWTKDNQTHLAILREYVSKATVGHGRTLLEKLGRKRPQINKYYGDNPLNEEQAIQDGLLAWVGGVNPTWGVLLKAMEEMKDDIGIQACDELKAKLCQ